MRALITGVSRGIGAALQVEGRARGHEVLGTTRGGDLPLDVTNADAQARVAEATGTLDLLVCNAGIYLDRGVDFEALTAAQWSETLATNVTGVALTVQAQLRNLGTGGKIAIIGSQMGSSTQATGTGLIYRVSKAAVLNLGLNLSARLRDRGIAVGVYHPGWVQTDMGGSQAAVTPKESARGLWDRFTVLDMDRTGCFETWDGRDHPL